ncbi:MAG: hypothetical protein AUG79_01645 [Gemmatimonadetes bacterium 13_1_20CM_4_69_16]|nr:MAG: hypothetical protein AUG79_01645 [Gemmatimonadetes bacterium 13_1_20CM_4_69_16]
MAVRIPAADPAALVRIRLLAAAAVLVAVAALRFYESPAVATWLYVLAWYPTLLILDQVVVLRGGESLLAQPRALVTMLWWSAVIWFLFEAINFRLQDWYYVFLPASLPERWIGITLSLATVVPAVLLPERLLDRLGVWQQLRARPIPLRAQDPRVVFWVGWGTLAAALALPRYFHPLTWVAVWLVAEPVLYRTDPAHSLLVDLAAGRWGRIARLMAAGLFAGALWEAFNFVARGQWIYTVPFLEHIKLFEMPPIGFLGFPFFALEVWSVYHLLAPRTSNRTVLASAAFAILVLVGMDHWTVSSVTPRLADLPGISQEVRDRLAQAGWTDIFRLARAPTAELAYRARITPAEAQAARDVARLSTLRGIGTIHAAALIAGGIPSVAALGQADADSVWRIAHRGPRPTPAEVRVWIRAAQRETGGVSGDAGR